MNSSINIHEYPSDPSLVPAYRIAVMQAALEGKEVECYNRTCFNPSWTRIISEPIWDWNANQYRITPPKPRYFRNSSGLFVPCGGNPFPYWFTVDPDGTVHFDHLNGERKPTCWTLGEIEARVEKGVWVEFDGNVEAFRPKPKQPETIMEWLLTLPKEYRVLAIRNMDKQMEHVKRLDLPSAIGSAFVWSGSPEGHEFWESVRTSLERGIPLPPIPAPKADNAQLRAEVERLKAINDKRVEAWLDERACCDGRECGCMGVTRLEQLIGEEAGERISQLHLRVAELEQDKARLDWLDEQASEHGCSVIAWKDNTYTKFAWYRGWHEGVGRAVTQDTHPLRAVIDAARNVQT